MINSYHHPNKINNFIGILDYSIPGNSLYDYTSINNVPMSGNSLYYYNINTNISTIEQFTNDSMSQKEYNEYQLAVRTKDIYNNSN